MPPNPPRKAHSFAMRSMSLCDMQISKTKKNFWLLLPNPGYASGLSMTVKVTNRIFSVSALAQMAPVYTYIIRVMALLTVKTRVMKLTVQICSSGS